MLARAHHLLSCLMIAALPISAAPLTIGLLAGPAGADAADIQRGAELAVAESNRGATAPARLAARGQAGQWGSAGNEAVALAFEDGAGGIIAPSDGAANHLALQVASRTRIPVISLCPDSSITRAGVPWIVRIVPRTDDEAKRLFIAAARSRATPLRWRAFVPTGRAGRAVQRDLESASKAAQTRLERIVGCSASTTNFLSAAQDANAAKPNGILLWLPPAPAGRLAAALRAAGFGGWLAGPSSLDSPRFVAAAGGAAEGVIAAGFRAGPGADPLAQRFRAAYRQRFDAEPGFSAAAAYDAARLLIEILRRAGQGDAYRLFPLAGREVGATGALRFNAAGDRADALTLLVCRGGRFMPQTKETP